MTSDLIIQKLFDDLETAIVFVSKGEVNKSRVVARQVAGKAIRSLLPKINIKISPSVNPYQCLLIAKENIETFSPVIEDLNALTLKVNPDYTFPEELDLIKSAKNILEFVKDYK
ncbi:MAG TPA: hypothetical protein VK856_15530 [Anaerolineaceae bacterium]|nr:hypothetical protein [Anaerolineaceae bacterium]